MFQTEVVQKIKTHTQNEECFRQKLYRRSKHTLRIRNVSDRSCTEDQNTHLDYFIWTSFGLRVNVEKLGTARQATDDNKIQRRKHAICAPDNKGK